MAEPFDPYRDWLGIKGGRTAANYYLLFGLQPFAADETAIAAAADETIARFRRLKPGDRQETHQRLLKQLATARACLLDAKARARYDAALRKSQPGLVPARSDASSSASPVLKAIPLAPQAVAEKVSDAKSGELSELWDETAKVPRKLASASSGSGAIGMTITAMLILVAVAAGGGYWFWSRGNAQHAGVALSPSTSTSPASVSTTGADVVPASIQGEPAGPHRSSTPGATSVIDQPADSPTEKGDKKAEESPAKNQRTLTPSAREDVATSAERREAFQRAINQVRRTFAVRDLESVARHLALAKKNALSGADRDRVRQFQTLDEQLQHFFGAVRVGWKKFEPLDVVDVDGKTVVIAGIEADAVRVREEGQVHSYTIANLPPSLMFVMVKAGLNEDLPQTKVCWGAFHAVDRTGDREQARRFWRAAAAQGQNVDDLLPLLEPEALEIERAPVPSARALNASEAKLKERFGPSIAAATGAARKATLAAELLVAARDSQSVVEQYWLLHQSSDLCIAGGDAHTALEVADELGVWFAVDPLVLKSQALAGSLKATGGVAEAKDLGHLALALAEQADAVNRAEVAHELAETALAAGRKSRDRELIEQARNRLDKGSRRGKKTVPTKVAPARR